MKKTIPFALAAALVLPLCAQEVFDDEAAPDIEEASRSDAQESATHYAMWPAFFAVCEFPATPDLIGLRLTIPFSTKQENVTGFDLGLWGRAIYFEGLQVNVLRNDVKDSCAGVQVGLYNTVGRGDLLGVQAGLWNQSLSFRGVQAGLVNNSGDSQGFQIGLINRSETMYGFQFGLINIIRDAELQFCPFVNIGF